MTLLEAIVYGIVQGATEFLPISSSAHLALVPWLFGWAHPSFAFDVLVQLGTLGAVIVYLRDDIRRIAVAMPRALLSGRPFADPWARRGWLLIAATAPAVVFGIVMKSDVERAFVDTRRVLIELFITGLLLFAAEVVARYRRRSDRRITLPRAAAMGMGQALAVLPGISRSGATIAAGLAAGMSREEAGRFSFLMSIPVMLGAGVLSLDDMLQNPDMVRAEGPALGFAFVIAGIVGFLCIKWFVRVLQRTSLVGFGVYCCAVAALGLIALELS